MAAICYANYCYKDIEGGDAKIKERDAFILKMKIYLFVSIICLMLSIISYKICEMNML